MIKKDNLKILETATELMTKHLQVSAIEQVKGVDLEQSLTKAYKSVETALLTHIRQQVAQIKTILALSDSFVDSCYAFGALGLRNDLIRTKLLGETKSGKVAFCEAIEKDTRDFLTFIACESEGFDNQNAYNLAYDAYEINFLAHLNHTTNTKALAVTVLLDYGYTGINIGTVMQDLKFSSCLKAILDKNWAERSLAGYFDEDDVYVPNIVKPEFISIFAGKLKGLLAQSTPESADYFQKLQIKQYLHQQVISGFTMFCDVNPVEVYHEIDRLIAASKTNNGITQVVVEDGNFNLEFAVTKKYSSHGISYEINLEALQALSSLLEVLGLGDLPEVALIIGKIRAIRA